MKKQPRAAGRARRGRRGDFLAGGGEMGRRIRAFDWSATPLGPPKGWPQSLRTAVRIMLTSRQPIWIGWGRELTYLYNDAYQSIIGGRHPWALGKPTRQVWREIWPQISPMLDQAMGGEGTYVEEQLLIMERNGYPEETYYTYSYSPIDDGGRPGGVICANTDDTDRVLSERRRAVLKRVLDAALDARSWREACERTVAALAADDRSLPYVLLYAGASGEALPLIAACGIDRDHPAAAPSLPADGGGSWPYRSALGDGLVGLLRDVADRFDAPMPKGAWDRPSQAAAILSVDSGRESGRRIVLIAGLNPYRLIDQPHQDFLDQLRQQIYGAVASADAYEAERQRSEALAELDRAKTAFFSNVSHEFRTPLTLLLGPLEALLSNPSTDEHVLAEIKVAHRNGVRLLRLVNTLLDFSRIEAGRAEARYAATDLGAFSGEIAATFRSAFDKAGLALVVETEASPQPVYVDRDMWEKILLNLISNAFKFTLEGGVRIGVRPAAHGGAVEITVSDTGVGIPAHALPKLFERFYRLENRQSRSFEGSGIGLSLVRELVNAHGGTIDVQSVEGEGSTFTVTLPCGSGHLTETQVVDQAAPAAATGRALEYLDEALRWTPEAPEPRAQPEGAAPARILLADDNADMRDYLARLLGEHWNVETAADGLAALERLRERPADLVVTDVMMPRLDGFGLLAAVRADSELRELPVIVLTARAGQEARVEGLEAGADDYLTKPFSARELVARVQSNLDLARMRREARLAVQASEERLRVANASLEGRIAEEVAERSRAEQALRQAQKIEALGQLTGGVAHDFNNLLTVIIGGLDTIRRNEADVARVERALDMASQAAQRAASLTARLLAFSRRQPLAPRPTDANRLVRDLTDLLRSTLGEQVVLEIKLAARPWRIEVDQDQLASVLVNLAVNARDAMPEGGRLTIATANAQRPEPVAGDDDEIAPGEYVEVCVSDTGVGMDADTLARAFEPFFTTKEAGAGTGLGLSMVHGFVRQSGGYLDMTSSPGQGTAVRLYFPRYRGPLPAAGQAPASDSATAIEDEVVLLVEDNEGVRSYSADVLAELGYEVLSAPSAQEALDIITSNTRIDLLFTDVVLPGLSGRALADRALSLRPGLKVLFTTGYARDSIVRDGRVEPGVELITKPFTFEQLGARIRRLLDAPAPSGG